jgi:hypothetical protein
METLILSALLPLIDDTGSQPLMMQYFHKGYEQG